MPPGDDWLKVYLDRNKAWSNYDPALRDERRAELVREAPFVMGFVPGDGKDVYVRGERAEALAKAYFGGDFLEALRLDPDFVIPL